MKRKLLSLLLVLAMVLAIFPVSALAADDVFTYRVDMYGDTASAVITNYTGKEPDVEIPETIKGYPVVSIADGAFEDNSVIQSVYIPENVEYIGRRAFKGCADLTTVEFGGYFVDLGDYAFANCTSLEYMWVPCTGVLPSGLFSGCHNLSAVRIAEGNIAIRDGAFTDCDGLEYLYIPASMEIIYTDDFEEMENVTVEGIPGFRSNSVAQDFAEKMGFAFDSAEYPTGDEAVFPDVEGQHYYSLPVLWAAYTGVTNGKTDGNFGPGDTCNRGQMITFIWRFFGSPEPDYDNLHNFTDVAENSYCYDAVQWGYQQGIIKGVTDSEFRPKADVTRAMAVTMLHRLDGTPESSGTNNFTDVKKNAYYDAILWAQEVGIAQGYGDGTFRPSDTCTRGMIVTFMYRNLNEFYRYEDPYGDFVA